MPANRISPGVNGCVTDAPFYTCPIADIESGVVPRLIDLHRRASMPAVGLGTIIGNPTPAALDALSIIDGELAALRRKQAKRRAAK